MGKFYPDAETAMWAYIAGELKDCPCPTTACQHIRLLEAIGGALDPDKVIATNGKEKYMLLFAKNLKAMRTELAELRAKVEQ